MWVGITLTGMTELILVNGNETSERYIELQPTHLLPSATRTFGDMTNWILQEDKAPPHRAAILPQLKEYLGIRNM